MSNAAITIDNQAAVTPTALGWNVIHWRLRLFINAMQQ